MSQHSDHSNKEPEEALSSPTPVTTNNDDALEKGLLIENQTSKKSVTLPSPSAPDAPPSGLMLSTGPGGDTKPEGPAAIEPPKGIKLRRDNFRPRSPDQMTLLQSPPMKEGISLNPTEKPVVNPPQDPQSDIPAGLDEYGPFWKAYNDDADAQDKEIVEILGGDLDALLIFAGLFSASNVAFIVEAYRDLKQDNVDITNDLLRTLIHNQVSPSNPITAEITRFTASPRAIRVNALFFTSLSCSLLTALGAVLGKQWLNHYKREGRRMTLAERGRERQTKYMGLERWHLEQVVETLPTLLQLSLFLFLGALIDFLWPINRTIAGVIAGLSILTFSFYVITTTIAACFPSAPFQTRFSALLRTSSPSFLRFLVRTKKLALVVSLRRSFTAYWLKLSSFFIKPTNYQGRTTTISLRSLSERPSTDEIQSNSVLDDSRARIVRTSWPWLSSVLNKVSKGLNYAGWFSKRPSSPSPRVDVDEVGPVVPKDELSRECISWVLETSSVDKTLSLAATAALMLPGKGWERIETLDEIPRVLRLVLGARAFESRVILDAQPGTVKAVLEPLHALCMKWNHTTELVVPTLGDNGSFVTALENLLWRVVRTYPVEGTAAVWILEMLAKLGFSVEPRREEINILYQGVSEELVDYSRGLALTLGIIVLLESSMSFGSILYFANHLRYWDAGDVSDLLQPLQGSIILIDGSRFIRTVHPTVRSFFNDPTRSQNHNIPPSTSRHTAIALKCVDLITSHLKRNILETDNPLFLNEDISDLEKKVTDVGVSESLQYACRHWAIHLQYSSRSDPQLRDAVNLFCQTALLPWLELMSIIDCYDKTPLMIKYAETWMRSADPSSFAVTLLQDLHRFVILCQDSAKSSAAALYSVALPFAYPSLLHTHYYKETPSLNIYPGGSINFWTSTSKIISHTDGANAVAVSPNNNYILAGSIDGMIHLFTMSDGRCIATFKGHSARVQSVVFAPDNNTMVSGSYDRTIKVWDTTTGHLKATLMGHRDWVFTVKVSPDSRYIVSGGGEGTVRLWDANTGSHIATMEGHSDRVLAVDFSPDGHKILSASSDHTARIWNTADGTLLVKFDHSNPLSFAVFSLDGKLIASGSDDNLVKIWDAESYYLIHTLEGHSDRISSMAFSPDNRFIATASEDHTIRVWDALDGSVQTILEGHTDWIDNILFTSDQRYIISASIDGTVRIWNWKDRDGSLIKNPLAHTSCVMAIAFSSDGKIMASGGDNGEVYIWDVGDMAHVVRLNGRSESVESITFSSDGKYITASSSELTTSWDLDTHQTTSHPSSSHLSSLAHGATRNSGFDYQFALNADTLYVKQFSAGQEIRSRKILELPVPNISVNGSHKYLLGVGTKGGQIMILDFSSIISFEKLFDEKHTLLQT